MMEARVDFPAPDGPITATADPAPMCSVVGCRMRARRGTVTSSPTSCRSNTTSPRRTDAPAPPRPPPCRGCSPILAPSRPGPRRPRAGRASTTTTAVSPDDGRMAWNGTVRTGRHRRRRARASRRLRSEFASGRDHPRARNAGDGLAERDGRDPTSRRRSPGPGGREREWGSSGTWQVKLSSAALTSTGLARPDVLSPAARTRRPRPAWVRRPASARGSPGPGYRGIHPRPAAAHGHP